MNKILIYVMALLTAVSFPALPHGNDHGATLEISQAWARKTGSRTASAAVYLDIKNISETTEKLLFVQTERASMAMIHRSMEQDGIMRMTMQDNVEIGAGSTVSFEPGGLHIMLTNLTEPLKEGDIFPLTLTFDHAGDVQIYVAITGMAGLKKQ
jgi:copper(I)-binding protein